MVTSRGSEEAAITARRVVERRKRRWGERDLEKREGMARLTKREEERVRAEGERLKLAAVDMFAK
ncbi:hypothetical protein ACLOJK_007365 [Asimina triloba]